MNECDDEMIEKGHVWTDGDFDQLGWNSCRVYGFSLPGREHKFVIFLDYILRSPLSHPEQNGWQIVPAQLVFENVVNLQMDISSENCSEIDIINVERSIERPTPNEELQYRDYEIGLICNSAVKFTASSMTQIALSDCMQSDSCDLNREGDFFSGEKRALTPLITR